MVRDYVTRKEYTDWIMHGAALGAAVRYPITGEMINDSAGIVYGASQYEAFEKGLWSGDPYELMIIFESLNEPAFDGLPESAVSTSPFSGLCDKLMIVHPGKFCPPHYHTFKTESYEVIMGEMDVFYSENPVVDLFDEPVQEFGRMPAGGDWPSDVLLPEGREESYEKLDRYVRLKPGDSKFVMHRQHLHAFRCPPNSRVPLMVREISTYSHEPTEAAKDKPSPAKNWEGIHDNTFLSEDANTGRLKINIKE